MAGNNLASEDNKSRKFEDTVFYTCVKIGRTDERKTTLTSVLQTIMPRKIINVIASYAVELRIADFSVTGLFGNQMQGRLLKPYGIALSDKNVFVSNTKRNLITAYDFEGKFIREWSYESNLMRLQPTGIAVSEDKVYVCDAGRKRVYIFNTFGNFKKELDAYAPNIAVSENYIYLCNDCGEIKTYQDDGTRICCWNARDDENNLITKTRAFGVFSDRIFVCDYNRARILVFSLDGTYIRSWTIPGRKRAQPCAITVIHGQVYVGDKRYNCIYAFDWSGNYLRRYGSIFDPSPLQCVGDIAINESSLFVCDSKSHIVCIYQ